MALPTERDFELVAQMGAMNDEEPTPPVVDDLNTQQLALFGDEQLPLQPHLVDQAKQFVHTGRTTTRKTWLVAEIVRMSIMGVSDRSIAKRFAVSRNTVAAIRHLIVDTGKMEPEKEVLLANVKEIIGLASDNLIERMIARKVPDAVLNAIWGTSMDKYLALTGQATQIISVKRGPDPDQIRAELEQMRAAAGLTVEVQAPPPTDSQSPSNDSESQENGTLELLDTGSDTIERPPPALPALPDPAAQAPTPHDRGGGLEPGGERSPPDR